MSEYVSGGLLRCGCLILLVAATAAADAATDQVFTGAFEPCDGVFVDGSCWWFGQNNESCDTVCSDHGGYADGTRYFAGSEGDEAACGNVLTALSVENATPVFAQSTLVGTGGLGCGSDFTGTATSYRLTSTTTSSASSASNGSLYFRRACACAEQPAPTSISYAANPLQLPRGIAMTPVSPTVVGYAKSFGVAPALPSGMTLNTQTGVISGTPAVLQDPAQTHTVTVSNGGGSASTGLSVRVYAQPPTSFSYPGTPFTFNQNVAITPVSPSVYGAVTSYTFDPLPSGLTISSSTGVLSGTPTAVQSAQSYNVTAHNLDGMATTSISITVLGAVSCDSGGQVVGGTCWYFGQNNQSCDAVCSTHGGYNSATASFAGSGGTDANCGQVLTAVGAISPTPVTAQSSIGGISGLGCGSDYTNNATSYRITSTTTSSADSSGNSGLYFRRACSCNN